MKNVLFEYNLKYIIKYNSHFKGDFIGEICKNNEEQVRILKNVQKWNISIFHVYCIEHWLLHNKRENDILLVCGYLCSCSILKTMKKKEIKN